MRLALLAALLAVSAAPAWPRAGGGGGGGGGGCFPAGTMIASPSGVTPIERLRPGDKVLAFSDGRLIETEVRRFYAKKDLLLTITTSAGTLTTTGEHPLLASGGFTEAGKLSAGDAVAVLRDGQRVWTRVTAARRGGEAEVYNLEVAPPHTFIAGGFIVHNKGGGSYGGRRRGLRGSPVDIKLMMVLIVTSFLLNLFNSRRQTGGGSSGRTLLERGIIEPKAARTRAIMESLARGDRAFAPRALEDRVRNVFFRAQAAWQARDYSSMREVMMPAIYASHCAKTESMKARGETNMMEDVKVLGVDLVHVRCPREKEGRSFTALITASARDYIVYDGDEPRGSGAEPSTFQEFWSFYQLNGEWALARIDQTNDLDILNAPNLPAEPEAGAPARHAAGVAAAAIAAGAYAPPPPPPAAKTGGRWDRQKMEIAATLAFESVYDAWGRNDSSLLNKEFISAEALGRLNRIMQTRKEEGLTFEFGSLFTRRAEIVLTRPAERNALRLDEFTARITATAVRAMLRNGRPLHRDEAPQPFTEYWVFGRQLDDWKLRDILPRMDQEGIDNAQDGAPSPVQIEWYWKT